MLSPKRLRATLIRPTSGSATAPSLASGSVPSATAHRKAAAPTSFSTSTSVETAAHRVANLLQRPEQLDKIESLVRKTDDQKQSVEAHLKAALQKQLDDISTGIDNLEIATDTVHVVQSNLDDMQAQCNRVLDLSSRMDELEALNNRRKEALSTKENLYRIFTVPDTVRQLQSMLDGESPNLLEIHEQLTALEYCRDELLYHARELPDERNSLEWYFTEVERLRGELETRVFDLLKTALLRARDNSRALVSALRIVEREETIDKRVAEAATGEVAVGAPVLLVDVSRRPRRYRRQLEELLSQSIQERFEAELFPLTAESSDIEALMDRCTEVVYGDLIGVRKYALPCFPPHYNILRWYAQEYHRRLYGMLDHCASYMKEAPGILVLFKWLHTYQPILSENVGLSDADCATLQPVLLDQQADALLLRYTDVVRSKMNEWVRNLIETELTEWFVAPDGPPEPDTNADGHYITSATVILFQMVDQQVGVAFRTLHMPIILQVVQECVAMLLLFQTDFERALRREGERYFGTVPEERRAGFVEYMMAVVNNTRKCRDYANELAERVDRTIDQQYQEMCRNQIRGMVDGFTQLAEVAVDLLIDVLLMDIVPAFNALFTTAWYVVPSSTARTVESIVCTLDDYTGDFAHHMDADFFALLAFRLQLRVRAAFVARVLAPKTLLSPTRDVGNRIRSDTDRLVRCFIAMRPARRANDDTTLVMPGALVDVDPAVHARDITECFSVLTDLASLASDDETLRFSTFFKLYKEFPVEALAIAERLLRNRDDIARSDRGPILEGMRDMVVNTPVHPNPRKGNVFASCNLNM